MENPAQSESIFVEPGTSGDRDWGSFAAYLAVRLFSFPGVKGGCTQWQGDGFRVNGARFAPGRQQLNLGFGVLCRSGSF